MISFTSPTVWPVRTVIGIDDHSGFGLFDFFDLQGLLFKGHIFVNNAETSFPGHGDGGSVLGYRIHGGADQRYVERDLPGQFGGKVDIGRQDFRTGRDQKQIVEGISRSDFVDIHQYFSIRNEHGWARTVAAAGLRVKQTARAAKSGKARPVSY